MNGAFCTITGRQHVSLTASATFVDDAGKNGSLGEWGFSPTSFAFEGFEERSNAFPEIIWHFAKIDLFHGSFYANFIPDILLIRRKVRHGTSVLSRTWIIPGHKAL